MWFVNVRLKAKEEIENNNRDSPQQSNRELKHAEKNA